jgi:hypothetical protein
MGMFVELFLACGSEMREGLSSAAEMEVSRQ